MINVVQIEDNVKEKVKSLLKELFQFDNQDLDFGIYRIMNFKRHEIEEFIQQGLIAKAEEQFKEYSLVGQGSLLNDVEKLKNEIIRDFGTETIDEQGHVRKNEDAPKIKEYMQKVKELKNAEISDANINDVFNHIYEFFSRYYDKGDFLSKRRYGGREKYYVASNGEDVLLYWNNNDQYYVKTMEYFESFRFKAGSYKVNFVLKQADIDKNNTKSETKFFLLAENKTFEINQPERELDVFFSYRNLLDDEVSRYGKQNVQDCINAEIAKQLLFQIGEKGPGIELRAKIDGKNTFLERSLRKYVERNKSDYFVHPDLKAFLERELDFYIKNEVLDLGEIDSMDEARIRLNKAKIHAINEIGKRIIAFLAQIENFQKTLFEKRKFVLRADYCMTLDLVPEAFYEEIGGNIAQVSEWRKLFKIDESTKGQIFATNGKLKLNVDFLKAHKNLVLDTGLFDQNFKLRLLSALDGIDSITSGLIIKSDNFHALNLLKSKYKEAVKCVYIDPPYNTGKDEFLYKDNFQHSSWLTMMDNRLRLAKAFTGESSVFFVSIDDNEHHNLRSLMNRIFGENSFVSSIAIVNNLKGRNDRQHIATAHEYMLMYAGDDFLSNGIPLTEQMKDRFKKDENGEQYEWRDLRKRGRPDRREDRPKMFFSIFYDSEENNFSLVRQKNTDIEIYPRKSDGTDGRWRWGKDRVANNLTNLKAYFNNRSKKWEVLHRVYLQVDGQERTSKPKSIWIGGEYSTDVARRFILDLQPKCQLDHTKAIKQVENVVYHSMDDDDTIMDFFAGAGTTAQAVLNVNDEDDGFRKYILIEMANYFEPVLKENIERRMYSKTWKDGLPASNEGTSHAFKYIYLEQYEDSLDNIVFKEKDKTVQETLEGFQDYFLRYMLDFETKDSSTRLNIENFQMPFDYKIVVTVNGEKKNVTVDLIETFNFLLAVFVEKFRMFKNGELEYRVVFGKKNDENVVVIWRNSRDIDLVKDKKFVENTVLAGAEPDRIFINGDSYVKNALPIEPEFKRLMGA